MSELNNSPHKPSLEEFKQHYYFNLLEYFPGGTQRVHLLFRVPILDSENHETMTINILVDNSNDEQTLLFNQLTIEEKIHDDISLMLNDHTTNSINSIKQQNSDNEKKFIIARSVFDSTFCEFIKGISTDIIPDYFNHLKIYSNHGRVIDSKKILAEFNDIIETLIENIESKQNNPFKQRKKIDNFDFNYLLSNIEDQEKKKLFGNLDKSLISKNISGTKIKI